MIAGCSVMVAMNWSLTPRREVSCRRTSHTQARRRRTHGEEEWPSPRTSPQPPRSRDRFAALGAPWSETQQAVDESSAQPPASLSKNLQGYEGGQLFRSVREVDELLNAEWNAWDR